MGQEAARLWVSVDGRISGLEASLGKAERRLGQTEQALQRHGRSWISLGGVARTGAVAIGGAATLASVGMFKVGRATADFNTQLSALKANAQASARQMQQLRKQALDAGAATAFSATEAAAAQNELAKGGLKVEQILSGGLKGALALAAAGSIEVADAATYTANALNLFGLKGAKAMHVADALASAANATTADVGDFGMALTQGGAAAKAAGMSFDQTIVMLESLAKAGVKGSDAGTSLKASLTQIASPTSEAAAKAKELGIEFFDAGGKMKSAADVSAELRDGFRGLNDKQKLAAATTIAGTDGMRTLLALYDAGPRTLKGFEKGVTDQGTAAEVARIKQDNLRGDVEKLGGAAETAAIQFGDKLDPAMRGAAQAATDFIDGLSSGEGAGGAVAGIATDLGGAVGQFATQVQTGVGVGGQLRDIVVDIGSAAAGTAPSLLGLGGAVVSVGGFVGGAALDVAQFAAAVLSSQAGVVALNGALGGLVGYGAALAAMWAVGRVVAFSAAIGTAITMVRGLAVGGTGAAKAMGLLNLAISRTPWGAVAVAVGAAAGSLGLFSGKQREATVSAGQLATSAQRVHDAFRAQADAMRAVRDIDIDVAQRRANLKSANAAVAESERALAMARKTYGKDSLEAKTAEANLTQAKVSAKRAARDLGDVEEDSRKKRDAYAGTAGALTNEELKHNASIDRGVQSKKDDIAALDGQIKKYQRMGEHVEGTEGKIKGFRAEQKKLRDEIDRLQSKKITVDVEVSINGLGGPDETKRGQAAASAAANGKGDGWGLEGKLRKTVAGRTKDAAAAGKLDLAGILGGAAIRGTGLNAFNKLATSFGLSIGSGYRPGSITSSGNLSYHAMGRARDFPGPPAAMLRFARFMAGTYGSRLKELIYTPLGMSIKNGRRVPPYAQADHYDHVHVAMRTGGMVGGSGSGDRQPILAEAGEFMVRKRVVDKFGPTFFNNLNQGRLAGYSQGGIVGQIVKAGAASKANWREIVAAIAAGIVESDLKNLNHGDADSVGVFQQRNMAPWNKRNRMDPYQAALSFFAVAKGQRGKGLKAGQIAANVQNPRADLRGKYAKVVDRAVRLAKTAGVSPNGRVAPQRVAGPARGYEQQMAELENRMAGAESTRGTGDDVRILEQQRELQRTRLGSIDDRLAKIDKSLAKGVSPELREKLKAERVTLLGERAQITRDLKSTGDKLGELTGPKSSLAEYYRGGIAPSDRAAQALALAQLSGDSGGQRAALEQAVRAREDELGLAYWIKDFAKITEAAGNLGSARDALKQFDDAVTAAQPTQLDYTQAAIAEAALTETLDDDKREMGNLALIRQRELDAARAGGDPRKILEAATNLKSAQDALKQLTESIDKLDATTQQQNELLKEQNARLDRSLAVSQSETGTLRRYLADIVSGEIGGRIGLGSQSVRAPAGALARY